MKRIFDLCLIVQTQCIRLPGMFYHEGTGFDV